MKLQAPTSRPVPDFSYTSTDVLDKPVVARPMKNLNFCHCDLDNICTEQVGLTVINRVIRICLLASPDDATLNIISVKTVHTRPSLSNPILETQGGDLDRNRAVITTELQPEFFDNASPGDIAVFGTADIVSEGSRSKGQVAFFVRYDLRATTESPTLSPTITPAPTAEPQLGAIACPCDQESNSCLKDATYLTYGVGVEICIL